MILNLKLVSVIAAYIESSSFHAHACVWLTNKNRMTLNDDDSSVFFYASSIIYENWFRFDVIVISKKRRK